MIETPERGQDHVQGDAEEKTKPKKDPNFLRQGSPFGRRRRRSVRQKKQSRHGAEKVYRKDGAVRGRRSCSSRAAVITQEGKNKNRSGVTKE